MPIIVDLYCRVSTDPQEDNSSLDEQEAAGREYCHQRGLVIGMVHRETFSGFQYRERKKLLLMRERYREGKIQGVVIRTLDRLSRSQTQMAILMEEMEHYSITLHSVKEVIDDTPWENSPAWSWRSSPRWSAKRSWIGRSPAKSIRPNREKWSAA